MNELENARKEITRIDAEMARLFHCSSDYLLGLRDS